MAELNIFKEVTLPETLVANSIYLVAPVDGNDLNIYVTGIDASVVRRTLNKADIAAMIAEADAKDTPVATVNQIEFVTDIAARDALAGTTTTNFIVLVQDASGDATVNTGTASYVYVADNHRFHKIAEYESMDMVVNYANIVGRPAVEAAQIEAAVLAAHSHSNQALLNSLDTDEAGKLTVNGNRVSNVVFATPTW